MRFAFESLWIWWFTAWALVRRSDITRTRPLSFGTVTTLHPGFLPHKLSRCVENILTHPRFFQTNKLCMELNMDSFVKICWWWFLLFYVHCICTVVTQCCLNPPAFLHAVERLNMNHTVTQFLSTLCHIKVNLGTCTCLFLAITRTQSPGKYWNVVLEKGGEDQLDRECEKWRSVTVKEQRNILHEISKRKANWIGHILRRNCILRQVIEGKIKGGIEVTGRRGRRRRKLLDDVNERRGYSHLKEEALDRTMWKARVGRGSKWMTVCHLLICFVPNHTCL
jgi:hypothetical protein